MGEAGPAEPADDTAFGRRQRRSAEQTGGFVKGNSGGGWVRWTSSVLTGSRGSYKSRSVGVVTGRFASEDQAPPCGRSSTDGTFHPHGPFSLACATSPRSNSDLLPGIAGVVPMPRIRGDRVYCLTNGARPCT
jgi:hypothetical protein